MARFVFPEWTEKFKKWLLLLVAGGPVYLIALIAYGVTPEAIRTGYQPEQTVYLLANHDEEAQGLTGAALVADTLTARDVDLAFVVDEGLPVAEEIIPGVASPLALVGVADKGQLTVRLTVVRDGGHSSMPPQETAIGELARAIRALKDNPMPGRLGGLVRTTFDPLSAELPFIYRMGLANLWLFRPII